MSSRSRWIVIALAVIGFGFATMSAWTHYKVLTDPTYISPCNINETVNCTVVYQSRFSTVSGVPVALGGMFWFGLVGLVALATPNAKPKKPTGATLFVLSVVGLAVILYLGFASWFVLKTACLYCVGTYLAVIGIFVTVAASKALSIGQVPGRMTDELGDMWKSTIFVSLLIALIGGSVYGAMKFPREGVPMASASTGTLPQTLIDNFTAAWAQQPRVDVGVPADGAKVVIVKFNDFQCPPCGVTNNIYKPILDQFEQTNPGAVKYVLKDWPWNSKCNASLPSGQTMHAGACEAAAAARMAHERGHDAEMNMREWLYSHQPGMDPETVKAGAETVLGVKDFAAEYERMLPGIRQDVAQGMALKIHSTPTYFFNGVRVDEIMPPSYFELAIKLELNRK